MSSRKNPVASRCSQKKMTPKNDENKENHYNETPKSGKYCNTPKGSIKKRSAILRERFSSRKRTPRAFFGGNEMKDAKSQPFS